MKRLILFCILFFLTNTKFSFSESVHDYFFSSKEEFLAKFKKHLDKDVYKRIDEIRCKFVVWHEENNYFRMILPISYEIPRKFSSTLMDLFTEFDNKNDNICFVSQKNMTKLSVEELIIGINYSYVDLIKETICNTESNGFSDNNVEFYILEIENYALDIYYHLKNSSILCIANKLTNQKCIAHWKNEWFPLFQKSGSLKIYPIKIEISKCLYGISLTRLVGEFVYFNQKPVQIYDNPNSSILLKIDLNAESDLLFVNSIKSDKFDGGVVIFENCLFSNILNKYWRKNKNKNIVNRTFSFFSIIQKSEDFEPGMSDFTDEMKQKLSDTIKRIIDYCGSEKNGQIDIQVIGYADNIGKGVQNWVNINTELARKRADAVANWLQKEFIEINNFQFNINVMTCDPEEYQGTSRVVEIRVSDY